MAVLGKIEDTRVACDMDALDGKQTIGMTSEGFMTGVQFMFEGVKFKLDMSKANYLKVKAFMDRLQQAAGVSTETRPYDKPYAEYSEAEKELAKAMKTWAQKPGNMESQYRPRSTSGQVGERVYEAYMAAHPDAKWPTG